MNPVAELVPTGIINSIQPRRGGRGGGEEGGGGDENWEGFIDQWIISALNDLYYQLFSWDSLVILEHC